jgi:hypothetical protein
MRREGDEFSDALTYVHRSTVQTEQLNIVISITMLSKFATRAIKASTARTVFGEYVSKMIVIRFNKIQLK